MPSEDTVAALTSLFRITVSLQLVINVRIVSFLIDRRRCSDCSYRDEPGSLLSRLFALRAKSHHFQGMVAHFAGFYDQHQFNCGAFVISTHSGDRVQLVGRLVGMSAQAGPDTGEIRSDVTSVGQRSSPWTCNSVKVEVTFHLECKLHFPSAQLMLRQMHLTKVCESIEAK